MSGALKFDYYYGIETEQFSFYRVPRLLMKDSRFKALSSDAKLLYGLMLDRMSLSMKNGWLDEKNRAYIIYSVENIMEDLNCSKPTCIKIMRELDVENGIGLVEKKRRGLGKPDIIYVKNFASMPEKENGEAPEDTGVPEKTDTEVKKFDFQKSKSFTSESKETSTGKENNFIPESRETGVFEGKELGFHEENNRIFGFQKEESLTSRSKEILLPEVKEFDLQKSKNLTSRSKEFLLPEVKEFDPNYNNLSYNNQNYNNQNYNNPNYTDVSYDNPINLINLTNPVSPSVEETKVSAAGKCPDTIDGIDEINAYMALIRKNLCYDVYVEHNRCDNKGMYEEIYETVCDVVCVKRKTIRINGEDYPYEIVKSRFLKLDSTHVEYVMLCMQNTVTKIHNVRSYLITALYNAPSTINHYFQQEVQHDMYGGGWQEKGVV